MNFAQGMLLGALFMMPRGSYGGDNRGRLFLRFFSLQVGAEFSQKTQLAWLLEADRRRAARSLARRHLAASEPGSRCALTGGSVFFQSALAPWADDGDR